MARLLHFSLLCVLLLHFTLARAQADPDAMAHACLFGADSSCSITGSSVQCLQMPLNSCFRTAFGTYAVVQRMAHANASSTTYTYSLSSYADAACSATMGPAYDTGLRSEADCFFLGTAGAPLGFVSFLEPQRCNGLSVRR